MKATRMNNSNNSFFLKKMEEGQEKNIYCSICTVQDLQIKRHRSILSSIWMNTPNLRTLQQMSSGIPVLRTTYAINCRGREKILKRTLLVLNILNGENDVLCLGIWGVNALERWYERLILIKARNPSLQQERTWRLSAGEKLVFFFIVPCHPRRLDLLSWEVDLCVQMHRALSTIACVHINVCTLMYVMHA